MVVYQQDHGTAEAAVSNTHSGRAGVGIVAADLTAMDALRASAREREWPVLHVVLVLTAFERTRILLANVLRGEPDVLVAAENLRGAEQCRFECLIAVGMPDRAQAERVRLSITHRLYGATAGSRLLLVPMQGTGW